MPVGRLPEGGGRRLIEKQVLESSCVPFELSLSRFVWRLPTA